MIPEISSVKELVKKPKFKYSILTLALLTISIFLIPSLLPGDENIATEEVPKPYVTIGCDQVLWGDDEIELLTTTRNIENPEFQWIIDGQVVETAQKLDPGEHNIILNVNFSDQTLQAEKKIIVVNSINGVSLKGSRASNNKWGFQTLYYSKNFGVKGVKITIDSEPPAEVNSCGRLNSKPLAAGEHSWKAEYRGALIASGVFDIIETKEIKIKRIEVAPQYRTGDTVSGKIVVINTGSIPVAGFDIRTSVMNHKFEWMGDKAKREYYDKYTPTVNPGREYGIPIRVTIPEKVSGVRPTGLYSITIQLIMEGQVIDSKVVQTEVV